MQLFESILRFYTSVISSKKKNEKISMHLYLEYLKNLIFGPISGPFWSKNLKIGSPPPKKI